MGKFWISRSQGCWVDLFDLPGFRGRQVRLHGPAEFINLYLADEDWGDEILSVRAGPSAYVLCFEDLNLANSAIWIPPRGVISDVRATPMNAEPDSIRLLDRPPFAAEPGYGAYARALSGLPPYGGTR